MTPESTVLFKSMVLGTLTILHWMPPYSRGSTNELFKKKIQIHEVAGGKMSVVLEVRISRK